MQTNSILLFSFVQAKHVHFSIWQTRISFFPYTILILSKLLVVNLKPQIHFSFLSLGIQTRLKRKFENLPVLFLKLGMI